MTGTACGALLPVLAACYEYTPLETRTPPVGETVALGITDQGRVSLSERFGSGLSEIQGRVLSNSGNEYVVNVFRVSQINGESAAWSGETTRIDRSFVGTIKGRKLSPMRTTLLSLAGGTVLYFLVSRQLFGSVSGGPTTETPEPPLSTRIPAGHRY
jgi:hypothetical protein